MLLFRIAKTRYVRDLTGLGARLYGGRWNPKGFSVIYTASNRSLATVEYLVHVPIGILPDDLSIATIEVEDQTPEEIREDKLPKNWNRYESLPELMEIGKKWIVAGSSLLLKVPSAAVQNDHNILINPVHPAISNVKIVNVDPYTIDIRLLRSLKKP